MSDEAMNLTESSYLSMGLENEEFDVAYGDLSETFIKSSNPMSSPHLNESLIEELCAMGDVRYVEEDEDHTNDTAASHDINEDYNEQVENPTEKSSFATEMAADGLKRSYFVPQISSLGRESMSPTYRKPTKFIPESDINTPLARRQSVKIAECTVVSPFLLHTIFMLTLTLNFYSNLLVI